jgi:hypothetical protein
MSLVRFATAEAVFETFPELSQKIGTSPNERSPIDFLRSMISAGTRGGVVGLPVREGGAGPDRGRACPCPPRRRSMGQRPRRRTQAGGPGGRNQRSLRRPVDLGRARSGMGRWLSRFKSLPRDADAAIHDGARHAHGRPHVRVKRKLGTASALSASPHRRRHQACGRGSMRAGEE